jgi:REP element-mobilizing transposase RayT
MARKPREEFSGAVHHAFARGNRKQSIFLCNQDRLLYLHLIGEVVARKRWRVLAYCLMGNHVHLLVETPEPNLGSGMQRLHGLYAQTFNRRHRHHGHLFQGRFGSATVLTDEQLLQSARYIARNPVEARLCAGPAQYPWSSHGAVIGANGAPWWLDVARLLSFFGAHGGEPLRRYADFVELR